MAHFVRYFFLWSCSLEYAGDKVDVGGKVDVGDPIGIDIGLVDCIGMKVCDLAFGTTCFFSD